MVTDTLTGQDVDYRIDNPIGIDGVAGAEELPAFACLSALLGVGVRPPSPPSSSASAARAVPSGSR